VTSGVLPIAHRGASGTTPENTKLAFIRALDLGARVIELDVQLTRDATVIVFHDDTLDRTTSGTGKVADTDFAKIRKLDAGSWFSPTFAHLEVPTLEETLDVLRGRADLNIELKPEPDAGVRREKLVKHVVTAIARFSMFDSVIFSSFDDHAMRLVRSLVPAARIGILCMRETRESAFALADELGAENIHPESRMVDSALVAEVHASGRKLWAWTANEPGEIAVLSALGVDGLFTDYPDRVCNPKARRR